MLMGRRGDHALPTQRCDAEAWPTRRWRVDVASAPHQRAITTRWRFVARRRVSSRGDASPTHRERDADALPA